MKERERLGWERRELDQRSFAHFDSDTGAILQIWFCQIPPSVASGMIGVFDNVHWSLALPGHRVDLKSVREVEGDHPHCELVPATTQLDS